MMTRHLFYLWGVFCVSLPLCISLDQASFYGGSYISIPLKEAKNTTDIHFKFRTHLPNTLLLLVAGKKDYCIVRLDSGRLKLFINLGAGESELSSPHNSKLNDFKWHDISIVRKEANLSVTIDSLHTLKKRLPGKFFELNINYGLYLGRHGNQSDLFFGHLENFRGCLAEVAYNDLPVLDQARRRQSQASVHGVTWNCAAEFDSSSDKPISFVEDGAFMAVSHSMSRMVKLQFEIKTLDENCIVLYNSGLLIKLDLFAVEIWDGKLKAIFRHGEKIHEITSDEFVSDGHWHRISLRVTTTNLDLNVDKSTKNTKLPRLSGHLELNEVFYVGGIELNKRARAMSKGLKTADSNFKGCVRHLMIGEKLVSLANAHISEGLLPGCVWQYPCLNSPCESGTCVQKGLDSFDCQCHQEYCMSHNYNESIKVFSRGSLATDLELLALQTLEVLEGQSVLITPNNLHMILDYPKYGIREAGIIFRMVDVSAHGNVEIDVWPHEKNSFTLADVSRDKVHYIHDGSENYKDHLILEVEFSSEETFILPAYLQGRFKFTLPVNISPVNDPPNLNIPTTTALRLAQGTKKVINRNLLQIVDPDTPVKQLVYKIINPGSGHFEYIQKSSMPITSFTQLEVDDDQVVFVHDIANANDSYILLQVSDGIETSAVAKLRVTTFPQFWRLENNTGLLLIHQTSAVITPYNLSFVSNVPQSSENAQFQVTQGPQYGAIEIEKELGVWISTLTFTSNNLRHRQVRYRHITSLPDYDEFQFRTSLNSSLVFNFRITFAKCNLIQLDALPISLLSSWEGSITSEQLNYQTDPVPSPTTSISYHIKLAPQYGYLFSAISKYRMRNGDMFTQEDILSHHIKYRLHRKSYSYVCDNFFYVVTAPGCKNVTGNLTITHYPSNDTISKVQVVLERLQVEEGAKVNIATTHLNLQSDLITDLLFNITHPPLHGLLQVSKNNVLRNRTTFFTLKELQSNQLYYLHDDSETRHDSFKFMAMSREEENFQYVEVFHVDVILKNDNSPVRSIDKIFHVVVGGQRLLTGKDLQYLDTDLDTKTSEIIYTTRELPNGEVYSAKDPSLRISEFTQEDLDNEAVLFKHKGPEYGKMRLWVTDGQFYVNGILEIQASAPFIRVFSDRKLIVQHSKSVIITQQHLHFTTNLFATDEDVIYEVATEPAFGKVVFTDTLQKLDEFTQSQINNGQVSYLHEISTSSADEIGIRARCRDAVSAAQLGVWMLPASYWEPLIVRTCSLLSVEESTSALISKSILEIIQPDVPAGAITYHVSEPPRHGYLSILPTTLNGGDQAMNVRSFTQNLINDNRVLYIQSGANQTEDTIIFNVTNGMVWLHRLVFDIKIVPEHLYLGSNELSVNEGGIVPLTAVHLFVLTDYYKSRVTDYVILQEPTHGCLQVHGKCNKLHAFSQKEFTAGAVQYAHDGTENLQDEITLLAIAGQKRSIPLTIRIDVVPINNQRPKLVNNTGLTMWEGGTAVITNDMLAAIDADRPQETLRYQVLGSWWGNVSLISDPYTSLQYFTQELINKKMVAFRHQNGSETKFTFNVSDGLHSTKEYDFHIRTKPCVLNLIKNSRLHIFPLQKKHLTSENLLTSVADLERLVYFEIVNPPTLGRLIKESDSPGIFQVISSFTQKEVNESKIIYEHTHPFADLYANDSFTFNVKSYLTQPLLNQKLRIEISVSSGGLDAFVSFPKIKVDEGGMTGIPLNLSGVVTFLENHAGLHSPIIHASIKNPRHGQVFLQHSQNLTTFTQEQLESGQVFYQHDHSDSLEDQIHFSLHLIPGYIMLCNFSVPITVNPINDQPFTLVTPAPHLVVVQGENYTITKSDLSTEDADTAPSDLLYDVITAPSEGQLVLLPNMISINHFSQAHINGNKLVYIQNGSSLTDTFYLRIWDGKFRPVYTIFNVRVIPVTMNVSAGSPLYLQQGSNVVQLTEKQFVVESNAAKSKVHYIVRDGPRHGVIYVKDTPSNSFSQIDLYEENVMYMQTDMTTANDSFRLFVGVLSFNTSIGGEVEVVMKVQPLIQIGNFTVKSGEMNRLSLHILDGTPLAKLTNSNPIYTIIHSPQYGQVRKIIRSSGERRNVLDTPVNSFTHEDVQSGLIYIVIKDVEVGWNGLLDRLGFILAASIFQPAIGELKIIIKSPMHNEIFSTLAGPSDPAGHEGGMHMASPNMTRDYFLIVSMVAGVVILGVAVIIIIKCRSLETDEINKESQCAQPIPLPRPPDRLMTSSPTLKQQDRFASPIPAALPHCKVTPLRSDLDTNARYPYGVDEHQDDWSSCDASDPACPVRNNVMLRRNQYWV